MAPPPPPPLALSAVAGTWDFKTMAADKDTVLLTFTMTATADTTGWTIALQNRKPMAMTNVMASGDSVTADVPAYQSALRKGQMVSTHSVMRMHGDTLMGTTIAHYSKGPDSVVTLRVMGLRKPM
jgi:hypothetical protein